MKKHPTQWPWLVGSAGIALVAILVLWVPEPRDAPRDADGATGRASSSRVESTPGKRRSVSDPARGDRAARLRHEREVIEIGPRVVLATVNGKPVRLEHLMPGTADREAVEVDRTQYRSRLERAIEAELVFQEAEARGIQFTKSQQRRLAQIEPNHEADLEELKPYGLSWDSLSEEHVSFERRMLEAMMLRQNLVGSDAAVAPSPDREVQARYEQALQQLMSQLKGEAVIEMSSEVPD